MAIVVKDKTKDPLKEAGKTKSLDGIKSKAQPVEQMETIEQPKKRGFIRTTVDELRKVNWPSFKQTVNWAAIVTIFTVMISLTLGLVDHVFSASIDFIDCTSPQGRGNSTSLQECGRLLADKLTFRNQ